MRILITGGAGFIGSNLAKLLCSQDKKNPVRILDDLSSGKLENIKDINDSVEFIKGSILDVQVLKKAVHGVDYVFHMAAKVSVDGSITDPLGYHMVNTVGTLNVLNAAKAAGITRVVYSSSASVYGNSSAFPLNENTGIAPLSPYALQKYSGETYCLYFHAYSGLETIGLRYFNVYGPNQQESGPYSGVVYSFFRDGAKKGFLNIEGDGSQTRDFVYVGDVAKANMLALQADKRYCGTVYNVGTGKETSINTLAGSVAKTIGGGIEIRHTSSRKNDIKRSCSDIGKIKTSLGFAPSVDLNEGLGKTYEWIRNAQT
jgi:nucleoside-diphosphate-sugar epimerase